jgi:arylsulfatase A-like enzyme
MGIALKACFDRSVAPTNSRPNVVLIVVDTLRADVLGCYGLRGPNTKLIWTPSSDLWELYQLDRGPDEKHNLAIGSPERVQEWRSALDLVLSSLRRASDTSAVPIDESTLEQLRELGYLSD